MAYNNIKRAKKIILEENPELTARINRMINRKSASIHPAELRVLSKDILKVIEPVYEGPSRGVYLLGDAIMRLAAKRDAKALSDAIGSQHRKSYPNLYKK